MISMSCTKTNVNQFWHDVESVSAIASMMIEVIPRHNGACMCYFSDMFIKPTVKHKIGIYTHSLL